MAHKRNIGRILFYASQRAKPQMIARDKSPTTNHSYENDFGIILKA